MKKEKLPPPKYESPFPAGHKPAFTTDPEIVEHGHNVARNNSASEEEETPKKPEEKS